MRVLPVRLPVGGVLLDLWRALTVFRVVALVIVLFLIVRWQPIYDRPHVALAVAAGMIATTAAVGALAVRGLAHRWPVVGGDIVITAGLTLLSLPAQTAEQHQGGMVTLTTIWAAGPAIEAAFLIGPLGGVLAGFFQLGIASIVRGGYDGSTLYSGVLLIITGGVAGVVAVFTTRAEAELRAAAAAQAALAERERLARSIHDGVLQLLGLVHRTGRDEGGRWAALADDAARQEAALRGLITSAPVEAAGDELGALLRELRGPSVTVSTPGDSVRLRGADEIAAAVRAALQNVTAHAGDGAQAWVLLETLADGVRVTVRDDGCGVTGQRLDDAARDGRVGVARSIRGRIADLGGQCTIVSEPGEGTEIEMTVPRSGRGT